MKLRGISVNLARNEFEYNKYVNAANKKTKPWSSESSKAPFIIVTFQTGNGEEDLTKVQLSMTPDADFTSITAASDGEYAVDSDKKKLNVNLTKLTSMQLVLQAKNDCKYETAPLRLVANASIPEYTYTNEYSLVDVSDKASALELIDKVLIQGGACNPTVASLIYELVASSISGTQTSGIPEAPKDGKSYVRKNGAWVEAPAAGIAEAPKDGKTYGRKDGTWADVTAAAPTNLIIK